jgi:hypothetical protein
MKGLALLARTCSLHFTTAGAFPPNMYALERCMHWNAIYSTAVLYYTLTNMHTPLSLK